MMTRFKEHSEVPVPVWLQALGTDGSWHNDAMPHAWIWVDEAAYRGVEIWVNYDDLSEREIGCKWEVLLIVSESQYHNQTGVALYQGEDEATAIEAVNLGLEKLGSELRVQETGPLAGVWTPWAEVLCRNCHDTGEDMTNSRPKRQIKWPEGEKREGDGLGFCNACGGRVWVDEEVALLTRLRALAGGEMEQTGGMCAALSIKRPDGGTVVVTNLDLPITIGVYGPGDWEDTGIERQSYCLPPSTPDEAAAAVIKAALTEPLEGK
jgi:hypothetical protein